MHKFHVICVFTIFLSIHLTSAVVIKRESFMKNNTDNKPDVTLFKPITAETEKPLRLQPVPVRIFDQSEVVINSNKEDSFNEQSNSNAQIKRKPENGEEATYECYVGGNINLGEIKSFDDFYQKNCPKNAMNNLASRNIAPQSFQPPQTPQPPTFQVPVATHPVPYYPAFQQPSNNGYGNLPVPNSNWNGYAFNGIPNTMPVSAPQYPNPITPGFNPYVQNANEYNFQLTQALYQNIPFNPPYGAPVVQQFGYASQNGVPHPYYTGR